MTELRALLLDNLHALWSGQDYLEEPAQMIPPIMIWGAPGVGKSTLVRELAKELGIGFVDVRLAQREPVDMRGLPVPENDAVKWLVSSEWPRDKDSRGIIIFDELTAADRTLQVAAYEFILDRRLGDLYTVPNGWYIVAAGNRVEDNAVACAMSSALANRFMHVEVKPEADSFIAWAEAHRVHEAVVNFIRYRPELLFCQEGETLERGWPSPRSWERVSTMLKIAEHTGHSNMLTYAVPGLVGAGAAVEFLAFLRSMFFRSGLRNELLNGIVPAVPTRPDMIYALCGALTYYLSMEKNASDYARLADTVLRFALQLGNDFATMLMNGIFERITDKARRKVLTEHPAYATLLGKLGVNGQKQQ